jgi:hypothetical protein
VASAIEVLLAHELVPGPEAPGTADAERLKWLRESLVDGGPCAVEDVQDLALVAEAIRAGVVTARKCALPLEAEAEAKVDTVNDDEVFDLLSLYFKLTRPAEDGA